MADPNPFDRQAQLDACSEMIALYEHHGYLKQAAKYRRFAAVINASAASWHETLHRDGAKATLAQIAQYMQCPSKKRSPRNS